MVVFRVVFVATKPLAVLNTRRIASGYLAAITAGEVARIAARVVVVAVLTDRIKVDGKALLTQAGLNREGCRVELRHHGGTIVNIDTLNVVSRISIEGVASDVLLLDC